MSLESHTFPSDIIKAVAAIPADLLLPGAYPSLAHHLQSIGLPRPDFIDKSPVIMCLSDSQRHIFESSLSEPTPTQLPGLDSQTVSRFGALQLALGSSIGNLLSIPDVRGGALVQDIFPKEASRATASSSYGSEAEFVFHNDLSFLDNSEIPDVVTLGCVRNIEGAATAVARIEDILNGLSDSDLAELQKSQYSIRHTYHRGRATERVGEKQTAVMQPDGEICLGVDMTPQTHEASVALDSLHKLLLRISTSHNLQSGEVLVLPNKYVVHARDPFNMAADVDQRRWLQRINVGAVSFP